MNKKIIGLVLLIAGVGLLIWGYNMSQSVGGQITQAFNGAPEDKVMIMYIAGAACAVVGVFMALRK
jgi:TRAP-type C4-dicarboxylate transport system permease large subunit